MREQVSFHHSTGWSRYWWEQLWPWNPQNSAQTVSVATERPRWCLSQATPRLPKHHGRYSSRVLLLLLGLLPSR